ncbi:Hypothetical protein CINCED_3A013862 [Cinara cedri]|uniref:Uncharacterized protein n=1 Tax=Cinara cedri TaxID=506608 RepID=A0A5E4NHB4_9HEMI|nr:Hypothetical protein CINCED_3A013862 [Cinara cedri]
MGCIKIYNNHTDTIQTAESLRNVPANNGVKNLFYENSDNCMGIAEAQKYYEQLLELKKIKEKQKVYEYSEPQEVVPQLSLKKLLVNRYH